MFTIPTYLIGIILFLLLSVQCILICGAIKIIGFADYVQVEIEHIVNNNFGPGTNLTVGEADNVIQELIDNYPILANYIGSGYFEGHTTESMPMAAKEALIDFMTSYIIRRLLWCLGFTAIAAIIAIKTISINNSNRSTRSYERGRHSSGRQSIDHSRPRVRRTR